MRTQNIRNRMPITNPHALNLIRECKQVCEDLGFKVPKNLRFMQCEAKRRAGLACHDDKVIVLSSFVFKESDEAIKNTILHEMGHIIAGPGIKHGPVWQRIVEKMNQATGLHITRCYDDSEMPVHAAAIAKAYKYKFACEQCGQQLKYVKRSKFVDTYNEILPTGAPRWTCAVCGGTFKKIN